MFRRPKVGSKFCTNVCDLLHVYLTQVGGAICWLFQIYKCVVCLTLETKYVATSKSCKATIVCWQIVGSSRQLTLRTWSFLLMHNNVNTIPLTLKLSFTKSEKHIIHVKYYFLLWMPKDKQIEVVLITHLNIIYLTPSPKVFIMSFLCICLLQAGTSLANA